MQDLIDEWRDAIGAVLDWHPVMSAVHIAGVALAWLIAIFGGTLMGYGLAAFATVLAATALILVGQRINSGR